MRRVRGVLLVYTYTGHGGRVPLCSATGNAVVLKVGRQSRPPGALPDHEDPTVRAGAVPRRPERYVLQHIIAADDLQQRAARGGALLLGQQKQSPAGRTVDDSSGPDPSVSVGLTHHLRGCCFVACDARSHALSQHARLEAGSMT